MAPLAPAQARVHTCSPAAVNRATKGVGPLPLGASSVPPGAEPLR
ncbi:hypothetical protein [Corallococcus sp. 4LFB]